MRGLITLSGSTAGQRPCRRGGAQPPLDPSRVIAALRQLTSNTGLPDGELLQIAEHPISLTGSDLTGDFGALIQGQRTTIRKAPRISRTDAPLPSAPDRVPGTSGGPGVPGDSRTRPRTPAHLIIDAVPRHLSAPQLSQEISQQIYRENWQPSVPPPGSPLKISAAEIRRMHNARALPVAALKDESSETDIRLAITLRPGADPQTVQAQLARMHDLNLDHTAQFSAPLPELLRSWVTDHQHEDITASLSQFETAIHAGQPG